MQAQLLRDARTALRTANELKWLVGVLKLLPSDAQRRIVAKRFGYTPELVSVLRV